LDSALTAIVASIALLLLVAIQKTEKALAGLPACLLRSHSTSEQQRIAGAHD
jgi:hypothetical protein